MFPRILLPALFLFITFSCHPPAGVLAVSAPVPMAERPKNIILLIGDGMAAAQASAGIYWKGAGDAVWERFPVVGFHKSYSYDERITDSAAGATAFACGQKTKNNAVGIVPPDYGPCVTILEELDARGWSTGMVVSCSATHATPASFIAHVDLRAFTEAIADDYLKTPIDCFVGGGRSYFDERPDKKNLLDTLRQRGYVIRNGMSFHRLPLEGSAPFMLFTADREPLSASNGRNYMPGAVEKVCGFLQNRSRNGFFLMVEGSQIDWALHANDAGWLKSEMLDFDATVQAALRFAESNGETLVIVTGDHECGGIGLVEGGRWQFDPVFSTRFHSGTLVPVYAFGPKSDLFSGIYENTAIYYKMWEALGTPKMESK